VGDEALGRNACAAAARGPAHYRVELDHIIPVARGGKSTVANLRILRCAHDDVAARQVYGDEFMNCLTRSKGVNSRQPAPPR
jgi:hypothetical protein